MFEYLPYLALLGRILLLGYEKIILKQLSQDKPDEATVLYFGIALPFLAPLLFFSKMPQNFIFLLYIAIFSVIYMIAFILFVYALEAGEASLVSPLYDFNVLFVAILSAFFLAESLSILKFAGVILLIFGSSFLNQQKNPFQAIASLFHNKSCFYMILCSLFVALGRMLDGKMMKIEKLDPIVYSFFLYLGITICLVLRLAFIQYFSKSRNTAMQAKQNIFSSTLTLLKEKPITSIITGAINAYAYLFFVYAITKINVSVAQPLSMLAVVITMLFAKWIFHETIGHRLIGACIMLLGAYLVSEPSWLTAYFK